MDPDVCVQPAGGRPRLPEADVVVRPLRKSALFGTKAETHLQHLIIHPGPAITARIQRFWIATGLSCTPGTANMLQEVS